MSALLVMTTVIMTLSGQTSAEASPQRPVTFLSIVSQPGDFVGDGGTYLFTDHQAHLALEGAGGSQIWADTDMSIGPWWLFFLENQTGARISLGKHRVDDSDPSAYQLVVTGNGRGCSAATGSVDVRQISYDRDGSITRFDIAFTQTCRFSTGASMSGEFAYRSTTKTTPPVAPFVLHAGQSVKAGHPISNFDRESDHTGLAIVHGQAQLTRSTDQVAPAPPKVRVTWRTPTKGSQADRLVVRRDGTLALRTRAGRTVWSVRPKHAGPGDFLVVQSNGDLVLYTSRYRAIWSTGTAFVS